MQNHSENTKRIAKNTMMLYIRMLFSMVVSLFTTRVVLDTLGANDYGIYNLVGGVVALMGMVTTLLSTGTSRFITIALGKNNVTEIKHTFAASLTIHLILAFIIFIVGEVCGPWLVDRLNIPIERLNAAKFVFQLSLISAIVGIIQAPFNAAIIAHERMHVYAYISIWDVVAKLIIVYLLTVIAIDKLKLYSLLYFIIGLITVTMYLCYCRKHFDECKHIILKPDKKLYKEIFNYTGWNAIGSLAFTMNGQGITILLSSFGTVVNAARGIAGSVSGVVYKFVDSFQTAAKPQIIKLCAMRDYDGMNSLITRVSKFSSYLMGFIGIPLFIEMEYVLNLWLKDVPEYTIVFARLTLIQGLIQSMDFPIGTGIHAVGKMKLPNITSAFIYMIILPISYIAIKLGTSPEITYVLTICVYPLAMFMDLYIIWKYTGFRLWHFLYNVSLKSIVLILFTSIITSFITLRCLEAGFVRLIVTAALSSVIFLPLIYTFGFTKGERQYLKSLLIEKLHINRE